MYYFFTFPTSIIRLALILDLHVLKVFEDDTAV